jgi:transposase
MDQEILKPELVLRHAYSEQFKRKVIEEYLNTGVQKIDLLKKYSIKGKGAIQEWMRQLGYVDIYEKPPSLSIKPATRMAKEQIDPINNEEDKQSMARRIKELEKQLQEERLKSEAYNRMIEIAEEELKISIRKKRNTK